MDSFFKKHDLSGRSSGIFFSSTYTHQLSYLGPFMCRRCQGEARIFQCHIFKGGLEFSVSAGE